MDPMITTELDAFSAVQKDGNALEHVSEKWGCPLPWGMTSGPAPNELANPLASAGAWGAVRQGSWLSGRTCHGPSQDCPASLQPQA